MARRMSRHTPTRRYARLALPSDAAASFSVRHDAALLVHAGRASAHGGVQLSELDQAEVVGPSSAPLSRLKKISPMLHLAILPKLKINTRTMRNVLLP